MRIVAAAVTVGLSLSACATPYLAAELGRINRPIDVVWVGAEKFIYVPGDPNRNFGFETANTGRIIEPGLMYTDGGSIPRLAQIFKPFSPWGYGPAYIVHDWIFYGHYCQTDTATTNPRYEDGRRFADVNGDPLRPGTQYARPMTFDESALVLAEVIRTIEDNQQIKLQRLPAQLVTGAVDSAFAAALWNAPGQCERLRVTPEHIALVWVRYNDGRQPPPSTWKLSPYEIGMARPYLAAARSATRTLRPLPPNRRIRGVVAQRGLP